MDHHPRILIVDRDAIAAQALQALLAQHGYGVDVARDADTAIDELERARSVGARPFGVVLVDQDASNADGLGLVRRLHNNWPSVVPVMASAFRKVEAAVQAMRLGAADYLLKPVSEAELLDAIGRAAQRHLLQSEQETAQDPPGGELQTPTHPIECTTEDAGWTPMPLVEAMKEPERRILLAALEANGWNRGQTAKQLDINRTTLYKKIRQYRLDEPAA